MAGRLGELRLEQLPDDAERERGLELAPPRRDDPHGPLGGVRATVVEVLPARERVKVLLEFLGREQVIEVDLFSLLLPRKPLP